MGPRSMDGHGKIGGSRAVLRVEGPPPYLAALHDSTDHRSFYDSSDNCALVLDAIAKIVGRFRIALLTIDVFDTALLRARKSEAARFRSAAERFVRAAAAKAESPGFSANDAFLARVTAARAAYAMRRPGAEDCDPTFDTIAAGACALLGQPDLTQLYIETEIEAEIEDVMLNPLIPLIERRFPRLRTAFLSDTYLEGVRVSRILAAKLRTRKRPRTLSSADGYGSKAAGTLFDHVERSLRIEPAHALHLGDNLQSDYLSAKRRGWQALHLPVPEAELNARRVCFEKAVGRTRSTDGALRRELAFVP
ncbi:hypothetical protein NUH88_06275 [Nisaea acidiphila]|uniref:Uncharacterized protein n=1 Tax=Nisaea acidiphila TaxID=1862145 RepID=A0A9J7AVE2_9PROT|nr:hypothetical protein [Nisaea acidiphila]UUX51296.1 hypothetical protein NUH88_06275 [Nisaea acidiphila]